MRKFFFLMLLMCPLLLVAQNTRQIKGTILDRQSGEPIVGATIFIASSETSAKDYNPQGTSAGAEGYFTFTLPTSVKFVTVSMLGYEAVQVDISGKSNFVVRLTEQATLVDDVVVTGYQKIEKRKLTSSISTIDMKEISRIGVSSVEQLLEGQISGVYTSPTSGAPGAVAKTRVRSSVTINGTDDPLWVLDGMPLEGNEIPSDWDSKDNIDDLRTMSIAGMNPDDIESITVLKDAAATAIYGARAANGVIIITSKSGRVNQPLRVNASVATFVTSTPNFDKLNLMNASEKVDFELGVAKLGGVTAFSGMGAVARILDANNDRTNLVNGQDISSASQQAIDALRTSGTDWASEIYRPTINQQYSLSVSGGSEKAAYYFSTGYYNEQGTTRGTGFDRLNLTLKTDFFLLENLKFGVGMFGSSTNNSSYITDANAFASPSRYSRTVNPYLEAYDENGNYVYDPDMTAEVGNDVVLPYNFIEERENTNYELKNKSLKSLFDLEYKPVKSLRLYTQLGLQVENSEMERYSGEQSYVNRKFMYDASYNSDILFMPDGGIIKNSNTNNFQYNWKLQAEYALRLAEKHEVDFMTGVELRAYTNKAVTTQGFGYDPKTLTTKPVIFDDTPEGQSEAQTSNYIAYQQSFYENRFASYFATLSYTYDNRFTFFGSMRYDGTNLFGIDRAYRYTPLWAVSGAWNIDRERWLDNADWLSNLKLRVSYGLQGNVDRNTSPYVTGVWGNTNIGGVNEDMITAYLPNQYLCWETTNTWNFGLDFGVLDNRINMVVDVYKRVSDNLITAANIPLENGFSYTSSNFGKMTGQGIELSINSVNIVTKDFRWSTSFNISKSESIINEIGAENDLFSPSREGMSSTAVFGFAMAGLDDSGAPLMYNKDGDIVSMKDFFGSSYTAPVWGGDGMASLDMSADNIRDLQVYLGDATPEFTGGIVNSFSYKNFDLSISANFVINQLMTATPFYNPVNVQPGFNLSREATKIWSEDNTSGIYPALMPYFSGYYISEEPTDAQYAAMALDNSLIYNNLDIWSKNMSYLRINSIRFGYTLPSTVAKKLHLAAVRVSVEARNPFVISTNYDGYFDPESYGNIYAQPLARTISLGLNLTF